MPWSWFAGLRKLGMTRLEATLAALCVHSIHSWRKFGLELDAFQEYGIFTQAYGMTIFPLAGDLILRFPKLSSFKPKVKIKPVKKRRHMRGLSNTSS